MAIPPAAPGSMPLDPDAEAYARLLSIVNQNRDKNFIQRMLTPDTSPVLQDYAGPGTVGTHLISSAGIDGRNILYPEIVQRPGSNNLERLSRQDALRYALQSGEHIAFDSPEEAEWFGQNYKRLWGGRYQP